MTYQELIISNHSIKFTYKMIGTHWETRIRDSGNTTLHKVFPGGHITIAGANTAWEVYADGNYVGMVMKATGGWEGFIGEAYGDEKPEKVTYRTGPRKYAAEHLAHLAGLLDSNFNDINKETSK